MSRFIASARKPLLATLDQSTFSWPGKMKNGTVHLITPAYRPKRLSKSFARF